MQIVDSRGLDQLAWPAEDCARPMLSALVREGPRPFIANVAAEVRALVVDQGQIDPMRLSSRLPHHAAARPPSPAQRERGTGGEGHYVFPLVLVDQAPTRPSAYVCSPTTHYIDYARREVELELHDRPLLRAALPPLLEALRPLLRWSQVERIVYVNNWLLSTNLYPSLGGAELRAIRDGLLAAFPDHTIVFRSLNDGLNADMIARLEGLGFARVFSRQVYLLDPRDGAFRRRNNYGNDRRLARRSPYRRLAAAQLPPESAPRLCALYHDLYVGKYSTHNPQLTSYYVGRALAEGWLTISALAAGGRLDGVLGFIEQHGVITAPLVGYDRAVGEGAGLYRMLMLELVEQAAARGRMLHLSSGASSFKQLRGAAPALEYSLVYHRHLPPRRRLPWRLLGWLSRRAIIPLMRRYGL